MPLHLDDFQKPQFQGYVENIPAQREYKLAQFLPEEPTFDMNFAYNVINGVYGDSASITGWNASAPLRDKKEIEQAFGQVAKVQHATRLDEKELLSFNRPRHESEKAQVVEYVYVTADELSQGVDDIGEYMRAQALYTGKLVYEDVVNDISLDIDFGIPSANIFSNTTAWSEAKSTPLQDIQLAVKTFQTANQRRKPVVMHMTSATEAHLLQNEQIRTQVYGESNGGRLLTVGDVKNAFTNLSLPPYIINDDVIVVNGEEEQLLADDTIVLMGSDIGKMMVGPTVENDYSPGKFVTPLIQEDPPGQTIIIGKALFPAIKKPKEIVIMSV